MSIVFTSVGIPDYACTRRLCTSCTELFLNLGAVVRKGNNYSGPNLIAQHRIHQVLDNTMKEYQESEKIDALFAW